MPDTNGAHDLAQLGEKAAAEGAQAAELAAKQQQANDIVFANYPHFFKRARAIGELICDLPLDSLIAASKRHQTTAVFSNPTATVEQLAALRQQLDNDQKLLEAALHLQRVAKSLGLG